MGGVGLFVVEMSVWLEIWVVVGWVVFEIYCVYEVVLDECFEVVVDGGEGDVGEFGFYVGEDFVGGGVVVFFEENVVNEFVLGCGM